MPLAVLLALYVLVVPLMGLLNGGEFKSNASFEFESALRRLPEDLPAWQKYIVVLPPDSTPIHYHSASVARRCVNMGQQLLIITRTAFDSTEAPF
jgi:hypothetical protein